MTFIFLNLVFGCDDLRQVPHRIREDVEKLERRSKKESKPGRSATKMLVKNQLAEIKQIQRKRKEYHDSRERAARATSPNLNR